MRHVSSSSFAPRTFVAAGASDVIEWEELPSLASRVHVATSQPSPGVPPWDATRPSSLDIVSQPMPFREPLEGMAVREVLEPDIFRHFFGR